MQEWITAFNRGQRKLSKHDPQGALLEFRKAAACCPVSQRSDLARILLYLGISLERLGKGSLAVKAWVNARKLVKSGTVRYVCERWVNGYGMRRCMDARNDDYLAFKSIQVARYLSKRASGRFGSNAERDVVYDIIKDAWKLLSESGILNAMGLSEKLGVFRQARLDFPYLYAEDAMDMDCEILRGNFRPGNKKVLRIRSDDLCPCGSGLPSRMCCGRLYSCTEIESGLH